MNEDCLTITEIDPQSHSEHSVVHVPAISTLPEIVLSNNQHTKMETCLQPIAKKRNNLHAFLQNLDKLTSTL